MNEKVLRMIEGEEKYYPHALEQQFPHLLSKIMELWDSPELDPYLQQLMLDARDRPRQGFPPDVATDLLHLSRLSTELRARAAERAPG